MGGSVLDPISGLPIGPEVASDTAPRPERLVIAGRFIRLEPLTPIGIAHRCGRRPRWQAAAAIPV